jgi:phenol 2-monooxygenase
MPSCKVLNQSDARPWHIQELMPSTGAWRVVVFAGDVLNPSQFSRLAALGNALSSSSSFLHRHKPGADQNLAAFFEVLTIHSSPRGKVELLSLPEVFHPYSEEYGWDYGKVFVDDCSYHEGHGQAYASYGVDPTRGCVVVVRPDQYVSWIGDLEDVDEINTFFDRIFR